MTMNPDWLCALLRERYPRPSAATGLLTAALRPRVTLWEPLRPTLEQLPAHQTMLLVLQDPLVLPVPLWGEV